MLGKKLPKGPHGSFGAKPARALTFISIFIQMDIDDLAGIVPKGPCGPFGILCPILTQYHPKIIVAWVYSGFTSSFVIDD